MNKKFSTLMLGMLLTSAFASADNVNTALLKEASDVTLKSGKSYFVVADANGDGKWSAGELFLQATKTSGTYAAKGVTTGDVDQLKWTYAENQIGNNAYYYSLKNDALGIYLAFDENGTLVETDKVEKSYFTVEQGHAANKAFAQGDVLYSLECNGANALTIASNSVSVSGTGSKIILLEYKENTLQALTAAKTFNDVKGGEGFNVDFSANNTYEWANDNLSDLNLKAFAVVSPIAVGTNFEIPAGVYFATEYPASLNGTNVIASKADFDACTFVAVNPDMNYNIHEADRKNGIGFELMTVAGSAMNFYKLNDETDDASVKGEVFVGNACFTVVVPDAFRAADEYNFKLNNMRVLEDASKTAHVNKSGLYVGVVTDQNKNYLVTNDEGLAFKTTNSTLYDVTKLLKSEDAPAIYTMQFVSDVNKSTDFVGETGQYLTVGVQANQFALSSVEKMNSEDPMFQFVVSAIDKDKKTVTFTNRQTQKNFTVSLYENEDGSYTVYPTTTNNLYVSTFDGTTTNGIVTFKTGTLSNTKVVLTPVTVEDKFATFVNRAEGAGLVTFELAKNAEDAPELYVGATKNTTTGAIQAGNLLGYTDDLTQFELVKSDKPQSVVNGYVYLKDSRVLTSTVKDTVAYYTYQVKAFDADLDNLYMQITAATPAAKLATTNAANVIIKENVDGSVSLINATTNTILTNKDAQYMFVNAAKDKDGAWKIGANYDLVSKLSEGLKTFMVEESSSISYEAVPQHVSFEAVRGGFMTKDENNDARLAISNMATEDLTFWLDTVHSNYNIPYFYIVKNGAYMYNAADSAAYYSPRGNKRFDVEVAGTTYAKLIFKAGELTTSDTLRTTVNGQSVLVAEKDNAPKNIKGGLHNFHFQIVRAEEGSDEYLIRQNGKYVCQYNNYFYMGAKKDEAYRFVIEKQAAPTANEGIEVSEVKVIAGNGQITIMGAAGKKVVVSNILGKVVASQTISSDNATIAVPAGIVAVAVEGEAAVKAVVK